MFEILMMEKKETLKKEDMKKILSEIFEIVMDCSLSLKYTFKALFFRLFINEIAVEK